ncbi:MAG: hypothetical protein ACRER2_00935 [Methylococcales bacterium]
MAESFERKFQLSAQQPCFEGHFPNDPIVPGVMLLDMVRIITREWKPNTRIKALSNVKFHLSLHPEESFTITITETRKLLLHFVCHRGDQDIASGALTLEHSD